MREYVRTHAFPSSVNTNSHIDTCGKCNLRLLQKCNHQFDSGQQIESLCIQVSIYLYREFADEAELSRRRSPRYMWSDNKTAGG